MFVRAIDRAWHPDCIRSTQRMRVALKGTKHGRRRRGLNRLVQPDQNGARPTAALKEVAEIIESLGPNLESALRDIPVRRGDATDGPRRPDDDAQVPQSDLKDHETLTAVLSHLVETQPESASVHRGIQLLLSRQEPDGSWLGIALCTSRALGVMNAYHGNAGREERELGMARARQWLKDYYARQADKAGILDIYSFAFKWHPDESEALLAPVRDGLRREFLTRKIGLFFPCEFESYRLVLRDETVSQDEKAGLAGRLAETLLQKSWDLVHLDLVDTALSLALLSACRELIPDRAQDIATFVDKWAAFVVEQLREMTPGKGVQTQTWKRFALWEPCATGEEPCCAVSASAAEPQPNRQPNARGETDAGPLRNAGTDSPTSMAKEAHNKENSQNPRFEQTMRLARQH